MKSLIMWVVETISPRFDPVQELRGSKSHAMRELLAKAEREQGATDKTQTATQISKGNREGATAPVTAL